MRYGFSDKYTGLKGEEYFRYHNDFACRGGELNKRKFTPYISPTDNVLDFGCGAGWLLAALQCAKKVGVEPNKSAQQLCRDNGVDVYSAISDIPPQKFDVIISHHCLEHVPYPIQALSELRSYLTDTGKLVIVIPIDDWRVQRRINTNDRDHHLHTWTPRLLNNTLIEAGYREQEIRVLTHAWFRGWHKLYRCVPIRIFDGLCMIWSALRHKRQLLAVATKDTSVATVPNQSCTP